VEPPSAVSSSFLRRTNQLPPLYSRNKLRTLSPKYSKIAATDTRRDQIKVLMRPKQNLPAPALPCSIIANSRSDRGSSIFPHNRYLLESSHQVQISILKLELANPIAKTNHKAPLCNLRIPATLVDSVPQMKLSHNAGYYPMTKTQRLH
jgi:hypothetical protein